jgi:pyridoxamine 5'-phosphate oxidase
MDSLSRHEDYGQESLDETQLSNDPIQQFKVWLVEAEEQNIYEPNAFVLSTINADKSPSSRTVLLKGVSQEGLSFFTNFGSRKGKALEQNPRVSAVFGWYAMYRQVLIEGEVRKVSDKEADDYFHSRPHESQVAAWSSHQSQPIANRTALDEQFEGALERFRDSQVPRPDYWGGYIIIPTRIEFWKGRSNRMHDRIVFEREDQSPDWQVTRLQP